MLTLEKKKRSQITNPTLRNKEKTKEIQNKGNVGKNNTKDKTKK